MAKSRTTRTKWTGLSDEELLNYRFCDLKLDIRRTPLNEKIEQLYEEMERKNLRFKPHFWLSEEWFSPDGVPGVAVPFYLAHPRLTKLELRQMFEVEGGTHRWCMQLLRHETGHAICTAYRLHRKKRWRKIFGSSSKKYPQYYIPNTKSKNFVLHLDWWYAQSHPTEDFAETFAIWMKPRNNWRKHYDNWPVIRKLEYVDELMEEIRDMVPPVRSREFVEPLSRNRKTLREHYVTKREYYGVSIPEVYDGELIRLFTDRADSDGKKRSAAAFLGRIRPELSQVCARSIGESPYVIAQVIQSMISRCRGMNLRFSGEEQQVKIEVAIFICIQTINYLHDIRHRVMV